MTPIINMKIIIGAALLFASNLAATGEPVAAHAQASPYPLEVRVREVWSTFGDPGFGRPRGMLQWPDGTVWVGDSQVSEVEEISADGARTKRVLRAGEGPGELHRVYEIVPWRDGGIVIRDSRGFSFFGADKKFQRRMTWPVRLNTRGLVATPDGDLIASGAFGHDEDHELARYAVHRFDSRRGRHVKSWHAAADHRQWETVRLTSGGVLAVTSGGGLLVSDSAPFRITRYADLMGNGAQLVVEDEDVVSASERDRAVTYLPDGYQFTNAWTRSSFIDELEDGNILNVVRIWPEDEGSFTGEWLVVSPEGSILARTPVAKGYEVWNATPDGHYLAAYWDDAASTFAAVKLEVVVGTPPPR